MNKLIKEFVEVTSNFSLDELIVFTRNFNETYRNIIKIAAEHTYQNRLLIAETLYEELDKHSSEEKDEIEFVAGLYSLPDEVLNRVVESLEYSLN
jgi:c-di-GMP-related signal transduction protein